MFSMPQHTTPLHEEKTNILSKIRIKRTKVDRLLKKAYNGDRLSYIAIHDFVKKCADHSYVMPTFSKEIFVKIGFMGSDTTVNKDIVVSSGAYAKMKSFIIAMEKEYQQSIKNVGRTVKCCQK